MSRPEVGVREAATRNPAPRSGNHEPFSGWRAVSRATPLQHRRRATPRRPPTRVIGGRAFPLPPQAGSVVTADEIGHGLGCGIKAV
jgi:hypothetical protein